MNPEIKNLWLKALRSGEYQQTKNRLRRHDSYCVLGVLCDLYLESHKMLWRMYISDILDGYWFIEENGLFYENTLPPSVESWLGTTFEDLYEHGLILFNDGVNGYPQLSFSELADIIDKTF